MITPEEEEQMFDEIIAEEQKRHEEWQTAKNELEGLIHPKYFDFAESHESYSSEGIVEIIETDERKSGYTNYRHCRIKNTEDTLLYIHADGEVECFEESEYEGQPVEYWVWQQTGMLGDDYYGYLLLPMYDRRYWKINYSC